MSLPTDETAPSLREALCRHAPGLGLRSEAESDMDFLIAVYTSVRWEELAPVDWPDAAKRAFLEQQCRLQHDHYLKHYPGAERLLIVATHSADVVKVSEEAQRWSDPLDPHQDLIGRIYLRSGSTEIRLMDIALLPAYRGQGIGRCLIEALQVEGKRRHQQVTLHVEPNNPAQRLYQRLGFGLIEQRGVYDFLGWPSSI